MDRLTILASGMVAGDPGQGGATSAVLQYLLGLKRLGHEVWLAEPVKAITPRNADYFRRTVCGCGLDQTSALVAGRQTSSAFDAVPYDRLAAAARRADILVNIAGMLTDPELIGPPPVRVYLDLDPGFVQLWQHQGIDMRFAGHTHFVTIGQRIGHADCPIPTCGVAWIPTPQPVVLANWPVAPTVTRDAYTSVGNWRGYGSVVHDDVFYGQKAHSLRPLFDLPRRTQAKFQLAYSIHPDETADLDALRANGWQLLDPAEVAGDAGQYAAFVGESKAEFGLAKSGYVAARCGWFSDRSVAYLASGRPVVAQDTAFAAWLPTGDGLFAFRTADDVCAAVDAIDGDYPRHSRAARAIAEEHFDSDKVLTRLLERIGVA